MARNNRNVSFLIQRAGPALDVGATTLHENVEDWRKDGLPGQIIRPAADFWSAMYALAETGALRGEAEKLLEQARREPWFPSTFGTSGWETIRPDWWRRQIVNQGLDPAADTAHLKIPVLWFLAEDDENVPYGASSRVLLGLKNRSSVDLTLVAVRNAKHSFLVTEPDGSIRYTDDYWPMMAHWLQDNAIAKDSVFNCAD